MRSARTLMVIGCVMLLVLVLATCSKNQKNEPLGQIGDVTYSKNFSSQLTDANIWVERNFVFHEATNKQDIPDLKERVEAAFRNSLQSLQIETHEIYFKWVEVATQPVEFKITAYLTPAPKNVLSGTQSIEGAAILQTRNIRHHINRRRDYRICITRSRRLSSGFFIMINGLCSAAMSSPVRK